MYKVIYALGACIAVLGIVSLLAGLGQANRELVLSTGSSLFSLGALMIAAGFYLHSRKQEIRKALFGLQSGSGTGLLPCPRVAALPHLP